MSQTISSGLPAGQEGSEQPDHRARPAARSVFPNVFGEQQDFDASALMADAADRLEQAFLGRATFGLSVPSLNLAVWDWWIHLAGLPGKQLELARKAARKGVRFLEYLPRAASSNACTNCIEPLPQDSRFAGAAWQQWPFNAIHQSFLLWQQWWHNATTDVRGVSPHHAAVTNFTARQILDFWSPSNFPWLNPEVLQATRDEGGENFRRGASNFVDDWQRALLGQCPRGAESFVPGTQVARTPGKVVFRNHLIELIQYAPTTETAYAEPIFFVPAWIMKYYILDLSPHNSLVKYLVDRGHTVFMISWRNPGPEDRDSSIEDYLQMGVLDALATVGAIVPNRKIHAAGYCIGGTLLAIAAAKLARDKGLSLASMTLFAAQVDFEEAGELMLFIDDSQVSLLEDVMSAQGFLDPRQMAGAFQLLRSNDLIWSQHVNEYLLGKSPPMSDLMAWNADGTRMPYRMHSEYLRRLFLRNDLTAGRYESGGHPIALRDIKIPIFSVGTTKDHIAPWHSVYKINLFTDTDVTFLLVSGGHNVGIVNPPGNNIGSYQIGSRHRDDAYVDPDLWVHQTPRHEGSWWPEWQSWIAERSQASSPLPAMGNADAGYPILGDAPGEYVFQT